MYIYIYMRLKKEKLIFLKLFSHYFIFYSTRKILRSWISQVEISTFKGHSKFFSFPREVIYIFSSYLWTWISMNLIYLFRSLNFFMSRGLIPFFSMSTSRAFDHYLLLIFYFFYCNWKKIYIYRNLTKHY